MQDLTRYEDMRLSVERCARIDEASDIRDKAAALAAYARQRDDAELEVWTQEIKLRASIRIGELVRELDSHQGKRPGELRLSGETKSKEEAILEAGLSKPAAYRYQDLAGPRDVQAQIAGKAAAELYFAQARADRQPASIAGLRGVIKGAVEATLGPPPPRPRKEPPRDVMGPEWIDWVAAIRHLAESEIDLSGLTTQVPALNANSLKTARAALPRLQQWIHELEMCHDDEPRLCA